MAKCIWVTESQGQGQVLRGPPTENTIKKNGLKWSNISVKKYHQSPGLGVKSGSRNLGKSQVGHGWTRQKGVTLLPKYSVPIPSLRPLE